MSDQKKTGGPAFPRPASEDDQHFWPDQVGMTLRDYFAAKAMQALVTVAMGREGGANIIIKTAELSKMSEAELFADTAYELADAMLAERAK